MGSFTLWFINVVCVGKKRIIINNVIFYALKCNSQTIFHHNVIIIHQPLIQHNCFWICEQLNRCCAMCKFNNITKPIMIISTSKHQSENNNHGRGCYMITFVIIVMVGCNDLCIIKSFDLKHHDHKVKLVPIVIIVYNRQLLWKCSSTTLFSMVIPTIHVIIAIINISVCVLFTAIFTVNIVMTKFICIMALIMLIITTITAIIILITVTHQFHHQGFWILLLELIISNLYSLSYTFQLIPSIHLLYVTTLVCKHSPLTIFKLFYITTFTGQQDL